MIEKNIQNYFFIFFLFIPISIVLGPTVSLINLLIIDLFFLIFFFNKIKINCFDNQSIKVLLLIYFYLIINTLLAVDKEITLGRNLGFLRFIVFFIFINYFYNFFYKEKKFFNFWTLLISIVILDIYIEFFLGSNTFGWGSRFIDGVEQPNGRRIVSFFKDEPIAGAFISGFIFMIFGYLLKKFEANKLIPLMFIFIAFLSILLTGERSNTIKVFIGLLVFFSLLDFIDLKNKILIFFSIFLICFLSIFSFDFLKNRYVGLFKIFNSKEKIKFQFENNSYFKLYKSGYYIFKDNIFFGVGNKNYRIKSCEFAFDKKNLEANKYVCSTHPHQIYFEFLSEHGLFGSIILLASLFYLIFKILREIIESRNYIQLGCFIFVILNFVPVLPSGAFFSDFNSTIFWLNFSIMFACNKKTNIFKL